MNEHRFKLLAFDLDGTLVNSLGMIEEAINRVLTEADLPTIHGHALREPIGLPLEDCVRFWIEGVYPEGELVEQSLVHQISEGYRQHFRAMRDRGEMAEPMFPGVMETLNELMAPDVFMAIVTGKDLPGLTRVLDHHSFGHFFAGNLNTPTHYAGKPSPEMLIGAMEKSMQDLEDTVVIGDTVFDILMAQNAGVASVGVSYGNHSADRLIDAGADVIIDDFADLPAALATIS